MFQFSLKETLTSKVISDIWYDNPQSDPESSYLISGLTWWLGRLWSHVGQKWWQYEDNIRSRMRAWYPTSLPVLLPNSHWNSNPNFRCLQNRKAVGYYTYRSHLRSLLPTVTKMNLPTSSFSHLVCRRNTIILADGGLLWSHGSFGNIPNFSCL